MRTLNAVLLLTLILQGGVGSPRGSSPSSSSLAQVSSSSSDLVEEEGKPLRRLCGWRLANKLNQVCKGIYNKPTVTNNDLFYRSMRGGGPLYDFRPKTPEISTDDDFRYHFPKTDDSFYYYYYSSGGRETDDDGLPSGGYAFPEGKERSPFLSKQEASQMFKAHPRSKRGLSAECCRKACRVSELMGYCQ